MLAVRSYTWQQIGAVTMPVCTSSHEHTHYLRYTSPSAPPPANPHSHTYIPGKHLVVVDAENKHRQMLIHSWRGLGSCFINCGGIDKSSLPITHLLLVLLLIWRDAKSRCQTPSLNKDRQSTLFGYFD